MTWNLLYDAGSSNPVLCDYLEGVGQGGRWEGGSRGKTHIFITMADSCCYMAETNTIF